jgi:hypothetical protein
MSGDDDVVGVKIKTPIAFVISVVSKKNTMTGRGGGGGEGGGEICWQLVQKVWDSICSRACEIAHMRVRHHKELHMGRRR